MTIQLEQDTITPRLLQAFKTASELPTDKQDKLAQLLEEMANVGWNDVFSLLRTIFEKSYSKRTTSSPTLPQPTVNEAPIADPDPLHPVLTRIQSLVNWAKDWPDCESPAPSQNTIAHAQKWIKEAFKLLTASNLEWTKPNVTVGSYADIVLEWCDKNKQLVVYLQADESVTYLQVWGPDPNTEMADGDVQTLHQFIALMEWLTSER